MGSATQSAPSGRYQALLVDGPRDRTRLSLLTLPDGDPVEAFAVQENPRGAYVLAGNPNLLGTTPYRWVTTEEWTGLRRWLRFGRRTRQAGKVTSGTPLRLVR